MDGEAYARQLRELLPRGAAWNPEPGGPLAAVLRAIAEELAHVHQRGLDLIEEMDPRTTTELLPEWERALGLPDPCVADPSALSLQARRESVHARYTALGGQTPAYFEALADALGVPVTITEYRPPLAGVAICGEDDCGDSEHVRFVWRVALSQSLENAAQVECMFERLKPAHTVIYWDRQP